MRRFVVTIYICLLSILLTGLAQAYPSRSYTEYPVGSRTVFCTMDQNVAAVHEWLKSSDRNSLMNPLDANHPRTMVLYPGSYTFGRLVDDTNYVDIIQPYDFDPCACQLNGVITTTATKTRKYGFYCNGTNYNSFSDPNNDAGLVAYVTSYVAAHATDANLLDMNEGGVAVKRDGKLKDSNAADINQVLGYNPPTDANVKAQIQASLDVNGPNTARLLSKEAGYDAAAVRDTNDVNTEKLVAAGGALATDVNNLSKFNICTADTNALDANSGQTFYNATATTVIQYTLPATAVVGDKFALVDSNDTAGVDVNFAPGANNYFELPTGVNLSVGTKLYSVSDITSGIYVVCYKPLCWTIVGAFGEVTQ